MVIGITTFKERFESHLKPLVEQLNGRPAIVAVNASNKTGLDDDYRKQMMRFLSQHDNISAIFYQQMRGLCKMWNDLVIHSPHEWVLLLNDDVSIPNVGALMEHLEEATQEGQEMFTVNGSFSHFVVTKSIMAELGWFDERLLGFGEEDGDIVWRYIRRFGKMIPRLITDKIINISSDIRDESVTAGVRKYSLFNRAFAGFADKMDDVPVKYMASDVGLRGMFEYQVEDQIGNEAQYPYETFFMKHRGKL